MTLLDLLILLLVAGICGALGQAITGYSRGGCLVSIALGFVGAVLGLWLARALQLPELFAVQIGTTNFPIVWSMEMLASCDTRTTPGPSGTWV